MKNEKRTIFTAVLILAAIILLFSLSPSLEQRTQEAKMEKMLQDEQDTQMAKIHAVFLSWKQKGSTLLTDFVISNNGAKSINAIKVVCIGKDENKKDEILEQTFATKISTLTSKMLEDMKIGKAKLKLQAVACYIKEYE
ncbi:MAG: hypothetical protein ACTTIC_01205 [Helicobacteraceae bacterium]